MVVPSRESGRIESMVEAAKLASCARFSAAPFPAKGTIKYYSQCFAVVVKGISKASPYDI